MKKEEDSKDENQIYYELEKKDGFFPISDKSLDLINELNNFSVINHEDQETFLNKTSELTDSIFWDKTKYDFSEENYLKIPELPYINTPILVVPKYTEPLTVTPTNNVRWQADEGSVILNTASISNTLETGLTTQGLQNIGKFDVSQDISNIEPVYNTTDTDIIPHKHNSLVDILGGSFVRNKQDFATEHLSEIQEKFLVVLEDEVEQKKIANKEQMRANNLKEKELEIRKDEVKVNEEMLKVISGVQKELKTVKKLETKTDKHKYPFKIKAGTTWESIYIRFIDNENIEIIIGCKKHQTNFADMGFIDRRNDKYDLHWEFLLQLAKRGGQITTLDGNARDSFRKHKQILSNKLKNYFGIDYDPFVPYTTKDGYKIKVTLIPPEPDQTKENNGELLTL